MDEDDFPEWFQNVADDLEDVPPADVVPQRDTAPLPAGTPVTVVIPGEMLEDADGLPVGMKENRRLRGTITETGAIAGWIEKGITNE